jgi:small subunit ribosomal protein S6
MTQYETAFLLSPNLEEEETEKIIAQMVEVVSNKKGKMINEDRWGKRKLAYPIKKFEEAFYVFFLYEGDSDIPFELERRFKQSEAVLRYLTVKKESIKSVRQKKAASMEKEKDVPPEEKALEGEAAEAETPDKESIEKKAPVKEKEAPKKIAATEDDEPADKNKAARKKEKADKEEVDKEKTGDEKKVSAEKEEGVPEDVAPPEKEKEEG